MRIRHLLPLLLVMVTALLHSQTSPTYTAITGKLEGAANFTGGIINFTNTAKSVSAPLLRERNKLARLCFKLDAGDDYVKKSSNWNFNVQLTVNYTFNGFTTVTKTLTITNANPEQLKIEDVLIYFASGSPTLAVTTTVVINDGATPTPAALTGFIQSYINNNLRLSVTLVREYDVDVRYTTTSLANSPVVYPVSITNRLVTFSWQPGVTAFPNYELQVLKVYNTDTLLKYNQNQVSAPVNWSSALKVETQSYKNTISITMAEGTGFYIWRVRPIGTYFAGGSGNSENYGAWSYSFADNSICSLNKISLTTANPWPYAFYFSDPDEGINWLYNRVFTEGDYFNKASPSGVKMSEGMTYADGLLNVRQNQKYNSSDNTNSVTQTMIDYSGRPSLSTLPVPVNGGLTGYKPGFVKSTSGNTLYTAASFDADAKRQNPDPILDNGTDFSYYSNNTNALSNSGAPDAQQFGYKRSLYKNDGSGRLEEESGVGIVHAIGRGKTMVITYETPSDYELIRVFGEEAPIAASVLKTTTMDQNGINSITYTSLDGKVIATALGKINSSNLSPLERQASTFTVTNIIDENVDAGESIISSKRIAVSSNSTLINMSYVNQSLPGASTLCPSGSCNFQIRFFLEDITNRKSYVSDADNLTGQTNFTVGAGAAFAFPSGWRFVSTDGTATITPGGTNNNQVQLNIGEYIFGKQLVSANNKTYIENLINTENDKFRPVMEALAYKMKDVNNTNTYNSFLSFMSTLKTMITSYQTGGGVTSASLITYVGLDPSDLPVGYIFPTDFTLSAVTSSTADIETRDLTITTGCCGVMSVPIPKASICYLCDGSPSSQYTSTAISSMTFANSTASRDSITPYGIEDFKSSGGWSSLTSQQKRDAIYTLVDREFIQVLKDQLGEEGMDSTSGTGNDLWKVAPGFSYHSLNVMIANMLISQYYTGPVINHSGSWYAAAPDAVTGGYTLTGLVSTLTPAYNYDCKKMYQAWTNAVMLINTFEVEDDANVVTQFNDQDGNNSAQDRADSDDNWDIKNKYVKKYLKKKMGAELSDFSNSSDGALTRAQQEALTNIISSFMSSVGYQFAAIIDGAALPGTIASSVTGLPNDYLSYAETPFGSGFYTSVTTGTVSNSNVPYLFSVNNNSAQVSVYTCNSNTFNTLYYPYILKPEWMFKYFVYNVFENGQTISPAINYLSDNSVLLPHQVLTDINYSYNQPYSYLSAATATTLTAPDLCKTNPTLNYTLSGTSYTMLPRTHLNWSTDERMSFYQAIAYAPRCYANKGLATGSTLYDASTPLPECAPKATMIADAKTELMARINNCYDRSGAIRNAIVQELTSSCYTVVSCKTSNVAGVVSDPDIDVMVSAALSNITGQIQGIIDKLNLISMPPTNTVACNSPTAITSNYNNVMCDLPACSQQDCKEIVLFKNNTIDVTPSRKLSVKYFADCDQKILDMIESGTFLPSIDPLPGCTKSAKIWDNSACLPATTCGPNYSEKTTCPPSNFSKYSKTYSLTASH